MGLIETIFDFSTEDLSGHNFRYFVNVATSLDGIIAQAGHPIDISNEEDWGIVHKIRSESAAIIVGSTTVLVDDPSLLVKTKYVENPHHPIRIVLDRSGRLSGREKVFKNQDLAKTLWVTSRTVRRKKENSPEVVKVSMFEPIKTMVEKIEDKLNQLGVERRNIMIEGGAQVIKSFLENGYAKYFRLFRGNFVLGFGTPLFPTQLSCTFTPINARILGSGIEEVYKTEYLQAQM